MQHDEKLIKLDDHGPIFKVIIGHEFANLIFPC